MMVSEAYMTARREPASKARRVFNQEILPVAIDALGTAEGWLWQVSEATRRQPATACLAALCVGFLLARHDPSRRSS